MPSILWKDGHIVWKDGHIVWTDNAEECECCDGVCCDYILCPGGVAKQRRGWTWEVDIDDEIEIVARYQSAIDPLIVSSSLIKLTGMSAFNGTYTATWNEETCTHDVEFNPQSISWIEVLGGSPESGTATMDVSWSAYNNLYGFTIRGQAFMTGQHGGDHRWSLTFYTPYPCETQTVSAETSITADLVSGGGTATYTPTLQDLPQSCIPCEVCPDLEIDYYRATMECVIDGFPSVYVTDRAAFGTRRNRYIVTGLDQFNGTYILGTDPETCNFGNVQRQLELAVTIEEYDDGIPDQPLCDITILYNTGNTSGRFSLTVNKNGFTLNSSDADLPGANIDFASGAISDGCASGSNGVYHEGQCTGSSTFTYTSDWTFIPVSRV